MNTDIQNPVNEIPAENNLTEMQVSAVAEIENISMGSAATAVSNLLNAKVWITTPKVQVVKYKDIAYKDLMPVIYVKINYIKGISGSNIMILKQDDVQMILNQLMGQPLELSDDFVFDEMNISAVSEVMNQMMGSAATALSTFLNVPIDISTPEAIIGDGENKVKIHAYNPEDYVIAIRFNITVDKVINSEFVSIIDIDLAKKLANSMLSGFDENTVAQTDNPEAKPNPEQSAAPQPQQIPQPIPQPMPQPIPQSIPQPIPQSMQQSIPQSMQQQTQQPMQNMGYSGAPYMQPVYHNPVNIQSVQLQSFDNCGAGLSNEQQDNLQLLMNVPLNISVEIGNAQKKIKDILEFTQGTIIELDRQAGAPVDVIVNGHLIARGDVVVIDDNFAVRITEIVKSKLFDTLGNKE